MTAQLDGLQPKRGKTVVWSRALWEWFCESSAKNLAVTAKTLKTEGGYVVQHGGYLVTKKWITSFRQRQPIALQKAQLQTTLRDEEGEARLNKFLTYLYMQPNTPKAWVIPKQMSITSFFSRR